MPSNNQEAIRSSRRRCYAKHKVAYRQKIKDRKVYLKEWMQAYKTKLACIQCGESHPACLEFHHRNPKTKLFEVSYGPVNGYSIKKIEQEIAKCDVLCANCHKKLHAKIPGVTEA